MLLIGNCYFFGEIFSLSSPILTAQLKFVLGYLCWQNSRTASAPTLEAVTYSACDKNSIKATTLFRVCNPLAPTTSLPAICRCRQNHHCPQECQVAGVGSLPCIFGWSPIHSPVCSFPTQTGQPCGLTCAEQFSLLICWRFLWKKQGIAE